MDGPKGKTNLSTPEILFFYFSMADQSLLLSHKMIVKYFEVRNVNPKESLGFRQYTNIEKSIAYNSTSVSTLIGQVPVQEID